MQVHFHTHIFVWILNSFLVFISSCIPWELNPWPGHCQSSLYECMSCDWCVMLTFGVKCVIPSECTNRFSRIRKTGFTVCSFYEYLIVFLQIKTEIRELFYHLINLITCKADLFRWSSSHAILFYTEVWVCTGSWGQ